MSLKQTNLESNYVQRGRFYGPVYDVDHLATFEVGPKNGLLTAEDGMRKLRIMEKSQGVWTMSCQILIDTKYIVLYDKKTREELDLFPIELISEPTSVSTDDKSDQFNNVLLFTVLEDLKKNKSLSNSDITPTEMHLFQCKKHNSNEIVDEIYKAIDTLTFTHSKTSKTQDTVDSMRKYQHSLDDNNNTHFNSTHNHSKQKPNIDQDVKLLNSCFDDIEQFVTILQNSSEQCKELEKKKKNRKSKHKHSGDGLLEKRAQLPEPAQFTDAFQKIKFSFNLLAKLKPHIHDPNAPELIHFLFTPLALIFNVTKEESLKDITKKVWQPLLTKDAKDLLLNCLSSKEQDLWMSLGECWSITRDDVKLNPNLCPHAELTQVYRPVFSDGSSPQHDVIDNKPEMTKLAYESAAQANSQRYKQQYKQPQQVQISKQYLSTENLSEEMPHSANGLKKTNAQSRVNFSNGPVPVLHSAPVIQQPSSANQLQNQPIKTSQIRNYEEMKKWAMELKVRGAKVYEVKGDRQANNEKELNVKAGELIEVLDDKRNWWKCRNFYGIVGHAPVTILRPF